jgi:hypothetical protein
MAMYEARAPRIMAVPLECSFCLLGCVKGFAIFRLAGLLKPTPNNTYLEGGAHPETRFSYFNPPYRNKFVSNLRRLDFVARGNKSLRLHWIPPAESPTLARLCDVPKTT